VDAARFPVPVPASSRWATARRGGGPTQAGATPVHRPPPAPGAPSAHEPLPGGGTRVDDQALASASAEAAGVVLLVEDDEKFAELLARALGRIGLDARLAVTGDGALEAMRARQPVAAVVLDIMIPHPDGIEVCRQLRRDGWRGPIVIISALDSADTRTRARNAGADVFLPKPFRLSELLDAIATLVDGAPPRAGRSAP
jgi:CheY-like chemotaxis protein